MIILPECFCDSKNCVLQLPLDRGIILRLPIGLTFVLCSLFEWLDVAGLSSQEHFSVNTFSGYSLAKKKNIFSASQKGRRIRPFVSGEVHCSKQSYTNQWSSDMSRFGSFLHEDASRQSKHFPTAIPPPLLHHNDYILMVIFKYLVCLAWWK